MESVLAAGRAGRVVKALIKPMTQAEETTMNLPALSSAPAACAALSLLSWV